MSSIPQVQKAWKVVRRGIPSRALVCDEKATVPSTLAPGEILVKVQAAALNPVYVNHAYSRLHDPTNASQWVQTDGYAAQLRGQEAPRRGTRFLWCRRRRQRHRPAERTGSLWLHPRPYVKRDHAITDLSAFRLTGSMTALTLKSHQGSLAQYTRLPASYVVPRPAELSPTEAAGLSLAGLTAYQALFNIAKLEQGQHLFINGGSTAVGIAAIQLAKAIGCTVTASASEKREPLLRSLGVDNVRMSHLASPFDI